MHKRVGAIAGLVTGLMMSAVAGQAADWTVLEAGRVIADARKAPLGNTSIVVRDDVIVGLVPGFAGADAVPEKEGGDTVTVVDLRARTVMPGMIDNHVHLAADADVPFWRITQSTEADGAVLATENARITVQAGFTTVRDLGSGPESVFAVRDAVNRGTVPGPRILAAGPALSIVGGHGDVSGFSHAVSDALSSSFRLATCTGAVECTLKVREASKFGADVIKFTSTGGVLSEQGRGLGGHFRQEEMDAIVSAAHKLGLKVASHAHGARGIEGAVVAGVDSVEHGTFADTAALKEMKKRGTYFVPTLMAFKGIEERLGTGLYTPTVEKKVRQTLSDVGGAMKQAHRMGIPIAFGTDAGVFEHGRNAEELAMMVSYGEMSPQEVLVSATITAAALTGLSDTIGTLEAGKSADIIATVDNPLEAIETLENVVFVMGRGRVFRSE